MNIRSEFYDMGSIDDQNLITYTGNIAFYVCIFVD